MTEPVLVPIGRVESALRAPELAPKQRQGAPEAWLVFDAAVADGLRDLRSGDEAVVLTWLDRADRAQLAVHPRDDPSAPLTGVFSTRSADRPNPIGLHRVRIVAVDGLRVHVDRLEAVDGTPVVDLKPVLGPEPPAAVGWQRLADEAPGLAAFGAERLGGPPSYLATVRADGGPRVHPVTPVVAHDRLFLFMEPTSPKRRDLLERGQYALHSAVPDDSGTGGEFSLRGVAVPVDDAEGRAAATGAATYGPAERYVLFELLVAEARCQGYGDVALPEPSRWRATGGTPPSTPSAG